MVFFFVIIRELIIELKFKLEIIGIKNVRIILREFDRGVIF